MEVYETTERRRPYVRHRWIAEGNGARCMVCGITERQFENRIKNAPMIEHDCLATRQRKKKRVT